MKTKKVSIRRDLRAVETKLAEIINKYDDGEYSEFYYFPIFADKLARLNIKLSTLMGDMSLTHNNKVIKVNKIQILSK